MTGSNLTKSRGTSRSPSSSPSVPAQPQSGVRGTSAVDVRPGQGATSPINVSLGPSHPSPSIPTESGGAVPPRLAAPVTVWITERSQDQGKVSGSGFSTTVSDARVVTAHHYYSTAGAVSTVVPSGRTVDPSAVNTSGPPNTPLNLNTFVPIQAEGRGGVNIAVGVANGLERPQGAGDGQPLVGAANPEAPAAQPERTYAGYASDLLRPVGKFISEFAAHGSVQSVAVGLNTFIREEAAGHLLPIVEQFPISTQIAIFGVMQLGHAAIQSRRSAELNRDPEAAARALTGENMAAWTIRTGTADQRTPEQTVQHQKSLADLAFADKSIMATQALATAANVALLAAGFVVGSSVLPVILVNEIKTVGYALARDTVQATGKLVSGHENTHGLTQGQYHQAAGAYGVAVGTLGVIGAQLNRHINANTPPGETSIALLAGSAALMNTLAETFDWQNLSRHEAHNASRNAQGEDRSQVLGVANNRDDYSRLLGQTPGRVAVINCANALNLAVSMATSTLKPNEQLAVTAVLTTVIMGALHNTISPEWTAQGAVRAAVRTNNAQAAGGVAVANDGPLFVMV